VKQLRCAITFHGQIFPVTVELPDAWCNPFSCDGFGFGRMPLSVTLWPDVQKFPPADAETMKEANL
jgi:hypothetical protein